MGKTVRCGRLFCRDIFAVHDAVDVGIADEGVGFVDMGRGDEVVDCCGRFNDASCSRKPLGNRTF